MKPSRILTLVATAAAALTLNSCGMLVAFNASTGTTVPADGLYDADYDDGYIYYDGDIAYNDARRQAFYLSDKMAYELGLTQTQYEAVYEINLDYLLSLRGQQSLYGKYWRRRNSDLFFVLSASQYSRFVSFHYFYRPVYWYDDSYIFSIYDQYPDAGYYYFGHPIDYYSYRGGRNRLGESYYRGRFGSRSGNPIITNRMDNGDFAGRRTPSDNALRHRSFGSGAGNSSGQQGSFGNGRGSSGSQQGSFGFGGSRNGNGSNSGNNGNTGGRSFGNGSNGTTGSGNTGFTRSHEHGTVNRSDFGGSRNTQPQQSFSTSTTTRRDNGFSRSGSLPSTLDRPTPPSSSFGGASRSSSSFGGSRQLTPSSPSTPPSSSFGGASRSSSSFGGSRQPTPSSPSTPPSSSFGGASRSSSSFGGSRQPTPSSPSTPTRQIPTDNSSSGGHR